MIPEDKLEEVRLANEIVGVVQEYVALKRRGQNYFGLCPFHEENTPSFAVNPGRQTFHCYGCNRRGNVFGFVMELERVSFIEAVKMLAERAHIELPAYSRREGDGPTESELIVEANQLARDYFHTQLLNQTSDGAKHAMQYLLQRGFDEEIIRAYMIGYAPDGWDGLARKAADSTQSVETFVKAGLLKVGQQAGRPYDAFRDRVMFPIRNLSGRVIAFGGRRLSEPEPGEPAAKYINSPETAAYVKGRELFGLWEARNEIRRQERVILVEGYTDAISLAAAGIRCVCASLGTALTEQQARLLLRFARNVFIVYDGDDPGLTAARRAADVLLSCGAEPQIVEIPGGDDPDSFVRAHGSEAVWELVNHSKPVVKFHVDRRRAQDATLAQIARELVQTAALIPSTIERETFVQQIAANTGLSTETLLAELSQMRKPVPRDTAVRTAPAWPPKGVETLLTKALIRSHEIRDSVFKEWSPQDVKDPRLKRILDTLQEAQAVHRYPDVTTLLNSFPEPPERDFVAACESEDDLEDEKRVEIDRRTALDCLKALTIETVRQQIDDVKQRIRLEPDNATLPRTLMDLIAREKELRGTSH
ncbi:MAG: DNA primase [Calditrichaeota bacterium]|nr:DNA primase [Calditrichota bacterium]MCB9391385.1 DNA primase [Calditrichota bacterium]